MKKKKYKVVFCGDLTQNNGPANVNKNIIRYFHCTIVDTKMKNKIKMTFEFIYSLLTCDVFIFSSMYRTNYLLFNIAYIFNKKTIYLMHGCSQLDAKINKIKNVDSIIAREKKVISKINLILVVSKKYMSIVKKIYPNQQNKFYYLTNGVDYKDKYKNLETVKKDNHIAVCGGNRLIKSNKNISLAVNRLNKKQDNKKYTLNIYGLFYENNENIEENDFVKILGHLPQFELFKKLSASKLFVLNSQYESFGLSVIDALMCGCNILISKNAGITDILSLEENDIINDFNDISEIEEKIKYNLEHDNNKRILKTIDFEYYSWENVANRLIKIISRLQNGENYKETK